jgi:hypothetical protein
LSTGRASEETGRMNDSPLEGPALFAARVIAHDRSVELFRQVEQRHAEGLPLEVAKQAVLDAEIPALDREHGEAVSDLVVQMVMRVSPRGVSPAARRAFARRRRAALTEAAEASGRPLSGLESRLFDWFGWEPPRLKERLAPLTPGERR